MAKERWICCGECSEELAKVWEAIDELRRKVDQHVSDEQAGRAWFEEQAEHNRRVLEAAGAISGEEFDPS